MKTNKHKLFAIGLSFLMVFQALVMPATGLSLARMPAGDALTAHAATNDPDLKNWSIRLDFVDPENDQALTEDYSLSIDKQTLSEQQIKLQVTIKYTGDGTVTYAPEDVKFTLTDLRGMMQACLDTDYSYDIAAEEKGSGSGRGDWYYTSTDLGKYELGDNTYVFTNKNEISSATTSTFQIIMEPTAYYVIPDYQKDFSTALTFKNLTGSVPSNTASFTYHGTKSIYGLQLDYEEIEDGISDEILGKVPSDKSSDDYIFAKVKVTVPFVSAKIAEIYHSHLEANFPDDVLVGNHIMYTGYDYSIFPGAKVKVEDGSVFSVDGQLSNSYPLGGESDETIWFYVAFPREKYANLGTFSQKFTLSGMFYGNPMEELTTSTLTFNFSEFNYVWEPGDLYSQVKSAYSFSSTSRNEKSYDYNYVDTNMAYSYKHPEYAFGMDYYIKTTAIYCGKAFDLVIGDDLQYFLYDDNTYRKAEDDERIIKNVTIFSVPSASGAEVYGRKPGSDTFEKYISYSSLSSSKEVEFEEEYCEVKIKYLNVQETLQGKITTVEVAMTDNVERDNGKTPIKVYNFSYLDILQDDKPAQFKRIAVNTNIGGLSEEIDAYDMATYGYKHYRSADYKTVLPGKAGIDPSTGSSSYYDGDIEVTSDRIYYTHGNRPSFFDDQGGGNTWCDFTDVFTLPVNWDVDLDEIGFYYSLYSWDCRLITMADGKQYELSGMPTLDELPISLQEQITMDKKILDDGRVQVTIHYDFKDNPLMNTGKRTAFFVPIFKIYMDTDTFQMLKMEGKQVCLKTNRSINQASNTTVFTLTSRDSNEYFTLPTIAYSTYQGVSMETSVDDGIFSKEEKTIEPGQSYEYKIRIATESSQIKNVIFYDNLDDAYGENPYWQGTFDGVNVTALKSLGASPKIYYSTNAAQKQDLTASGWTLSSNFTGAKSDVKAVAIDLGDFVIGPNSMVYAIINMKAPNDGVISGDAAYNHASVSYKSYDATATNLTTATPLEDIQNLFSNISKIKMDAGAFVHITYHPNGAPGEAVTDTVDADKSYTVKENPFDYPGYTFIGWDPNPNRTDGKADFPLKTTMSSALAGFDITKPEINNYVDLHAIWKKDITLSYDANGGTGAPADQTKTIYNETKSATFTLSDKVPTREGFVFMGWDPSNAAAKGLFGGQKVELTDSTTYYAIWNEIPEIAAENLTFMEGEKVTKEDLLEKATAHDTEDGDLTDKLRIVELIYADGEIDSWDKDMPNDYLLDTWFMNVEKDNPVIHQITYEVTDSVGNTVQKTVDIHIIYNEFPEVTARDLYFTLDEAQAGEITLDVISEHIRAWDTEDCSAHCPDGTLEGENCLDDDSKCVFAENNLKIIGFDADVFLGYNAPGYEVITCHVIDSGGKEALRQFTVYVLDDGETLKGSSKSRIVRFIDEKNYEKNANVAVDGLSLEDIALLNKDASYHTGGLYVGSIWYRNEAYINALQDVFAMTDESAPMERWVFSLAEVEEVREFVNERGVGNSHNPDALDAFRSEFGGNLE